MSKALVEYKGKAAGILEETDEGYEFRYDREYLADAAAAPVSLTLPLSEKPYKSPVLFPFFDGLIPEGWLLDVALRNTDISELDRFSLLLLCCKDCIGAVSVIPIKEDGDV
jgi:serine/threonine-protein kinase HipA